MAKPSADVKNLRIKKIYSEMRIPKVRQELKETADQKSKLSGSLRDMESLDPKAQKTIRMEAIYLSRRIEILKAEMKELTSGRKTLINRLKEGKKSE